MRRIGVLALVLFAVGVGYGVAAAVTKTPPSSATSTTVATPPATTVTTTTPAVVSADPTMDAQCVPEPNLPPACTQGSYQVAIPIGASCQNPAYQQPETWQWTYSGSQTARCETVP
jgi:hypothetical protein